jgi:hypothetical protein
VKPIPFSSFAELAGVKLSPGQRALARVAFDGREPRELEGEERELARTIFGPRLEDVDARARRLVALVCGARGGKSLMLAYRGLHAALTAPVRVARGERAVVLFVGADIRYARLLLRLAAGAAREHASMRALIVSESSDAMTLRRPDGIDVELVALPAGEGGRSVRGRVILAAAIDEADFLRDGLDGELVAAILPRLIPGAQLIVASTPWSREGVLYKLHAENWNVARHALVAHASTAVLRMGDPEIASMLESESARDPINAAREYGAQWIDGGDAYFDSASIDRAIDATRPLILPPSPGARVGVGLDLAFRADGCSLVVVSELSPGAVHVARVELVAPQRGKPLVPSEVLATFADIARSYGAKHAVADAHYLEANREALAAQGISLIAAGTSAQSKAAVFAYLRELLHGGELRLPPSGPLRDELRAIVQRHVPGGGVKIESPRRAGSHGDAASALAAATWALKLTRGSLGAPSIVRVPFNGNPWAFRGSTRW